MTRSTLSLSEARKSEELRVQTILQARDRVVRMLKDYGITELTHSPAPFEALVARYVEIYLRQEQWSTILAKLDVLASRLTLIVP